MKRMMYYRRLERLIKTIDLKLNTLPESPFGSDYVFFHPDEHKTRLSGTEFKNLMEAIELNFENNDGEQFKVMLRGCITEKRIKAHELYNSAIIEKSYFYQLLSGRHLPSRDVAIRLCLALKLDLEKSKKLLQSLGYALYERNRRDIVIVECIKFKTGLYTAEMMLDKYGEISLCNKAILFGKEPFKSQ